MKKIAIFGCGGHSKVVLESFNRQKNEEYKIDCFIEKNSELWNRFFWGIKVKGGDGIVPDLIKKGVKYFINGIGTTGDCTLRHKIFISGIEMGLKPFTVVDPTALISSQVTLDDGCQILVGAIVNAGAKIGINTIINSGAIVEHDCQVGESVHIAPGVTVSGNVKIGGLSHIGTGASIIQGIKIGKNVIVGAGSVVINDIEDNCVVAGVPAKIIKKRESNE